MQIPEPLGLSGAPLETLQAVMNGVSPQHSQLILLTDRQGQRERARYAALFMTGQGTQATAQLSAAAFGPHFGEAGQTALAELVHWAVSHDMSVRETVLNGPEFDHVTDETDAGTVQQLRAASNPSDAGIYTKLPSKVEAEF